MSFIHQFKSRSKTEFDTLLSPHLESLYRLAYRFTGTREDAEDLLQELLLRLFPRIKTLREVRELRPWLARSLYNLYIDTIRSRQRSPFGYLDSDSEATLLDLEDQQLNPAEQLAASQREDQLANAVNTLSEEHRSLVIMHDMEGYTLNEISHVMDVPLGTLKSRLHRARHKLRKKVNKEPFANDQRVNA